MWTPRKKRKQIYPAQKGILMVHGWHKAFCCLCLWIENLDFGCLSLSLVWFSSPFSRTLVCVCVCVCEKVANCIYFIVPFFPGASRSSLHAEHFGNFSRRRKQTTLRSKKKNVWDLFRQTVEPLIPPCDPEFPLWHVCKHRFWQVFDCFSKSGLAVSSVPKGQLHRHCK